MLLDFRTLSSFQSGQYLVWRVSGHVQFRIMKRRAQMVSRDVRAVDTVADIRVFRYAVAVFGVINALRASLGSILIPVVVLGVAPRTMIVGSLS